MSRVGGQSPDSYGFSTTVLVTDASDTNPVHSSYPLMWDTTTAHGASICADGDPVQLIAKHTVQDTLTPLGAWVCGTADSRINVLIYSGADPAIGDAIVADGNGGVRAADTVGGETGTGRVLYVDPSRNKVEVLV